MSVIYLNIETTSNVAMIPFLPEPTPPKNYKKPEAKANWVAKAKVAQVEKAPLDLDLARIISIAVAKDDDAPEGWTMPDDKRQDAHEEQILLAQFWGWVAEATVADNGIFQLAGYNIRNFDLPILLRRTWQLGIKPPMDIAAVLSRDSYVIVDLMEALYHNGYTSTRYRGLKAICQMYGIPNPVLGVDGSMVDGLSAGELLAYNKNDVALMQELARRTEGYYWFR